MEMYGRPNWNCNFQMQNRILIYVGKELVLHSISYEIFI